MSAFIVNPETLAIVGVVQNAEAAAAQHDDNMLVIESSKDLEGLSLQKLTDMHNAFAQQVPALLLNPPINKFKIAKDKAAEKVFALLGQIDLTDLVKIDAEEEKIVEDQAKITAQAEIAAPPPTDANGKKVRKVRDSKLQRMKAAFLERDEEGGLKKWTIKELMEKCGTTERITHVYISILRSPSDRFVMPIEKLPVEAGQPAQFIHRPKGEAKVDEQPQPEAASEQAPA